MKLLSEAPAGFLAGFVISAGGAAYLVMENVLAGALMFTVGLFAICSFGWNLFTGKVCYSIGKRPGYAAFLAVVWLSNFAGAAAGGALLRLTRLEQAVARAQAIAEVKLDDSLLSVLVLALFCNVLIYIAVEGYRSIPYELGKYLAVFFGVNVFVVCASSTAWPICFTSPWPGPGRARRCFSLPSTPLATPAAACSSRLLRSSAAS